jgi:exonuclease III
LNSSVRQDSVRDFVETVMVDVVCLQETKMQNISYLTILSMLGSNFSEYIFFPSVGVSGGILVAWRHNLKSTGQSRIDNHSVSGSVL